MIAIAPKRSRCLAPVLAGASLLLSLHVQAQERAPHAMQARATRLAFDCQKIRLPSQREVGEFVGAGNFSQAYAARTHLLGTVARACKRHGVAQVLLVRGPREEGPATRAMAAARDTVVIVFS